MTSLPTRERGLKCISSKALIAGVESLPTRERGLKYLSLSAIWTIERSLPTRERGLKLLPPLRFRASFVAPHAGAWIEIFDDTRELYEFSVAPHAGAWIEMYLLYPL